MKEFKRFFLSLWTKISEENRKQMIHFISLMLNFLLNSILFSIPITIIIFHAFSWKQYGITIICVWILLPFVEHYYVWFRETWKDNIRR